MNKSRKRGSVNSCLAYVNRCEGITLIALVVTIVVLLILAGVSISMLTGESGIISKSIDSKDKTEQAKVEELVTLAVNGLMTENLGDKSKITPELIAEEVNKMENRTDVKAEENTFPTNIIFTKENRYVGINIELSVTGRIEPEIYSVPEAEDNIAPEDLFDYEIIDEAETGATSLKQLPTKKVRIIRIKSQYCNGDGYNPETDSNDWTNTNYEINYKGMKISETLVIPYKVEGKYVKGGQENEMYKVTEVNLFAEGKDDWNFNGFIFPKVQTVIYPNTVEKIYGKEHMDEVEYNTTLQSVILSNKLKEIGEYSFRDCSNLVNIEIPSSVTSIGKGAFFYCSNLTSITIPDSVTYIGYNAFCETPWYENQPNGDVYIGKVYYEYKGEMPENTSITMKEGTTAIVDSAFSGCSSLTSITIPDSVTSIGDRAFWGCSSLTSITIPDSVTSIGDYAFSGCSSLITINYTGTEEEWNKLYISYGNDNLENATVNYNYIGE